MGEWGGFGGRVLPQNFFNLVDVIFFYSGASWGWPAADGQYLNLFRFIAYNNKCLANFPQLETS